MSDNVNGVLGIFGGTFDPVHFAHLRLAEEAADALNLSRVRWIPTGRPALREAPKENASQRLEMVRLAIADNARFELDSAEVESEEQTSFTVPTLERLRHPAECGTERPLVLLVGADAFAGMTKWFRWECIFDLAHVAVAHRPGYPIDEAHLHPELAAVYRRRFHLDPARLAQAPAGTIVSFALTPMDISATKIRALLSKSQSVRYLTPENVAAHIREHSLYTEK